MDPADLLAELVLQAEIAQVVDEVNTELEQLVRAPSVQRSRGAQTRQLQETVDSWMRV